MKDVFVKIDGRNYRAVVNWNVFTEFAEISGIRLSEFANIKDQLTPSQILNMAWASLKEGARIDKKDFNFQPIDVGAALSISSMLEIFEVFKEIN